MPAALTAEQVFDVELLAFAAVQTADADFKIGAKRVEFVGNRSRQNPHFS